MRERIETPSILLVDDEIGEDAQKRLAAESD